MANINKRELTKAQIEKAMACKTSEELLAAAEAEAYFDELSECELKDGDLKHVAGGNCPTKCSGVKPVWENW